MQQMANGIVAELQADWLHLSAVVDRLWRVGEDWVLAVNGCEERFDAVVLATPAWASGRILREVDEELSATLLDGPYSSSVTVNLLYDEQEAGRLPEGFGFLVPASEGRRMLACTFVHNKFPGRVPKGKVLLRCFLGGARREELLMQSDFALESTMRDELEQILGLRAQPLAVRVYRWRAAMAQYTVGHKRRMATVRAAVENLPGLALAGNGYEGIGVPDCIRTGRAAVVSVLASRQAEALAV
jgi:oxygen-dependent protoporphyrinogen oxidase